MHVWMYARMHIYIMSYARVCAHECSKAVISLLLFKSHINMYVHMYVSMYVKAGITIWLLLIN